MKVLAKFRLWEKAERHRGNVTNPETHPNIHLKFSAVQDAIFGPYTPSGELSMVVIKDVGDLFVLGQEYHLLFTPVAALDDGPH